MAGLSVMLFVAVLLSVCLTVVTVIQAPEEARSTRGEKQLQGLVGEVGTLANVQTKLVTDLQGRRERPEREYVVSEDTVERMRKLRELQKTLIPVQYLPSALFMEKLNDAARVLPTPGEWLPKAKVPSAVYANYSERDSQPPVSHPRVNVADLMASNGTDVDEGSIKPFNDITVGSGLE